METITTQIKEAASFLSKTDLQNPARYIRHFINLSTRIFISIKKSDSANNYSSGDFTSLSGNGMSQHYRLMNSEIFSLASFFTLSQSLVIRISFILTLLSASFSASACSCDWGGNFIKAAKNGQLVIKGKVIKRTYHLENGARYDDINQAIQAQIDGNPDKDYEMSESITIEIVEIIRGQETNKTIDIFNTDGADCRESTEHFDLGETYIFSTHRISQSGPGLPNETNADYAIYGCAENWLKFITDTNKVRGKIRGVSLRKKVTSLKYKRLLKALKE